MKTRRYDQPNVGTHDCNLSRKCLDSRYNKHHKYTRRRHVCEKCNSRWTTIELIVHGKSRNLKAVLAKELGKTFIPERLLKTMRDFSAAVQFTQSERANS